MGSNEEGRYFSAPLLDRHFLPKSVSSYCPILAPPAFIVPAGTSHRPRIVPSSYSNYKLLEYVKDLKDPLDLSASPSPDKELSIDEIEKRFAEEDGAYYTPQTSKYNFGDPSTDNDNESRENPSLDMEEWAACLDTIFEEAEGGEQEGEMWKFDSAQMVFCSKSEEPKEKSETQLSEDSLHGKRDAQTKQAKGKEPIGTGRSAIFVTDQLPAVGKRAKIDGDRDGIFNRYTIDELNPMLMLNTPFHKGVKDLILGRFTSAALCLEAAVQRGWQSKPMLHELRITWLCLGVSQVANEQDILAINAFNEYLKYQPNDLEALMFLAICYLNEGYNNLSMITLWEWLCKEPSYSNIVKISPPKEMYDLSTPMNMNFHRKLEILYLKADNMYPNRPVNTNIQCALGFLNNMVKDYAKAIKRFNRAVMIDPNDEIAWNFLGEALRNSNQNYESIEVFHIALYLRPMYVRARYNLGVCCRNIGLHKDAMEQFLTALSIQAKSSRGLVGTLTETIWLSVKDLVNLMKRIDLEEAVEQRDLVLLNKEFEIELVKPVMPSKNTTVHRLYKYAYFVYLSTS